MPKPHKSILSKASSKTSVQADASVSSMPLPWAITLTLLMVVVVREGTWVMCSLLGYPTATNIVAMVVMFSILLLWRWSVGIPRWISLASNKLLVDSGFAFLPISAGAGLLLFALGDEFWGVLFTIAVSTLVPLWGLAKLTNIWFDRHSG